MMTGAERFGGSPSARRRSTFVWMVVAAALIILTTVTTVAAPRALRAQPPASFDRVVASLSSPKPDERVNALKQLAAAGYPEAEVPVAKLLTDPVASVRLAAIAAEMNSFLSEPLTGRSRVAFVIEVRNRTGAQAAFSEGLLALTPQPLPAEVLTGLVAASADPDPRVAREALYGLGVVGPLLAGPTRAASLAAIGQRVAPALRNPDPAVRGAALEVLARAFDQYGAPAPPVDAALGDAVITEMNDGDADVRAAAVQALGAIRDERAMQALTDRFQYFKTRGDQQAGPTLAALARIAHASTLAFFDGLLTDAQPAIRTGAVEGIARTSDLAHVTDIVRRLKGDPDGGVNLALNFAVARAGGLVPLDTFIAVLANPALAPNAEAYLLELTATGRAGVDDWTHALQTQDLDTRLSLARIVGLSGDASLVPALKPLLNDADPRIADTARRGIARLQLVPARPTTRP